MNLEDAIRWYFTDRNKEKADQKISPPFRSNPAKAVYVCQVCGRGISEIESEGNGGWCGVCQKIKEEKEDEQIEKSRSQPKSYQCVMCGRYGSNLGLDKRGICAKCVIEIRAIPQIKEIKSGYRGEVRASYVKTDWGTTFPSVSVPPATAAMMSWDYPYTSFENKAEALEQQVRELTEQIEKLKGTGIEASGDNDILITGRKFRKTEEETADECNNYRGPKAE